MAAFHTQLSEKSFTEFSLSIIIADGQEVDPQRCVGILLLSIGLCTWMMWGKNPHKFHQSGSWLVDNTCLSLMRLIDWCSQRSVFNEYRYNLSSLENRQGQELWPRIGTWLLEHCTVLPHSFCMQDCAKPLGPFSNSLLISGGMKNKSEHSKRTIREDSSFTSKGTVCQNQAVFLLTHFLQTRQWLQNDQKAQLRWPQPDVPPSECHSVFPILNSQFWIPIAECKHFYKSWRLSGISLLAAFEVFASCVSCFSKAEDSSSMQPEQDVQHNFFRVFI